MMFKYIGDNLKESKRDGGGEDEERAKEKEMVKPGSCMCPSLRPLAPSTPSL